MPTLIDYIERQPEILQKALEHRAELTNELCKLFSENTIRRVYFVGSGTSYYICMAASDYFNKYLNVEASAHYPAVFTNNIKINKSHVYQPNEILVVGVSHSGTSLSTVTALEFAKSHGYITLSYSQNNESRLTEICDLAIRTQCEKELVPPETQGYTAAVLGAYLWAITIAKDQHLIDDYDKKISNMMELLHNQLPQVIDQAKT